MTDVPDTPFVTGETFEQLLAREVWVTPTGLSRTTLADALAAVAGGSITEVVVNAGPFLSAVTITTTGTITGSVNPTVHGVLIGAGSSPVNSTTALLSGQLLVGQGLSADPLPRTAGGDVTVDNLGNFGLVATGVVAGTYGDATNTAQIDVAADGRLLSVVNVPITGGGGTASLALIETIATWGM